MTKPFGIEGKCSRCGGTAFDVPANAGDGAWITCSKCGERYMSWGAYKAKATKAAAAAARNAFGKKT